MSGGNRNYIDKVELRKTLYIKCMEHLSGMTINLFGQLSTSQGAEEFSSI